MSVSLSFLITLLFILYDYLVSKGIIDLHGGTLSVCSEGPGKGSTFIITLPMASTSTSMTKPPSESSTYGGVAPTSTHGSEVKDLDTVGTVGTCLRYLRRNITCMLRKNSVLYFEASKDRLSSLATVRERLYNIIMIPIQSFGCCRLQQSINSHKNNNNNNNNKMAIKPYEISNTQKDQSIKSNHDMNDTYDDCSWYIGRRLNSLKYNNSKRIKRKFSNSNFVTIGIRKPSLKILSSSDSICIEKESINVPHKYSDMDVSQNKSMISGLIQPHRSHDNSEDILLNESIKIINRCGSFESPHRHCSNNNDNKNSKNQWISLRAQPNVHSTSTTYNSRLSKSKSNYNLSLLQDDLSTKFDRSESSEEVKLNGPYSSYLSSSLPSQKSTVVSKRILIVDDVPLNRKMLRRVLDNRYDCSEATNGQEAFDMVQATMRGGGGGSGGEGDGSYYDVITMDYQMPVMDGVEATKRIRQLGYIGVIIGVTGNALQEDVDTFLRNGANTVMTKPITMKQFLSYLSAAGV